MRTQLSIMITLLLISAWCFAGPVSTLYSTIDFPSDQSYINTHYPTIVGSLLDDNRDPESGQTVQILINAVVVGTTVSDDNGIYRFLLEQEIPDGPYAVSVFCVESQVDLGPNHFTVDTTLPPIEIVYPAQDESVSSGTIVVWGLTESNASVATFLDGDTYGNTCYADVFGNWFIEYGVDAGVHSIVAQATDIAGNQGPLSPVRNFSVNN